MNAKKTVTTGFFLLLLAASLLLAACSTPTPASPTVVPVTPTSGPVDLVKRYVAANNKHDLQGVSDLVTDDIIFLELQGGVTITQRQNVLNYHAAAFGENYVLNLGDCTTSGDTITCQLTYTQDCLMGGASLMHSKFVFTVANNKFSKILENDQEDEAKIANDFFNTKFIPWFEKTYPAEFPKSYEASLTYDYGVIFGKRCKEFLAIK